MSCDACLEAPAEPVRATAIGEALAPLLDFVSASTARDALRTEVVEKIQEALEKTGAEGVRDEPDEVYWSNYTSNMSPMWKDAGIDLVDFNGRPAADLDRALTPVLSVLRADPGRWRAYDAPNGWGTYASALEWLDGILAACREHPDAVVRVSR